MPFLVLGSYTLVVCGELSLRQSALGLGCQETNKLSEKNATPEELERCRAWYGSQNLQKKYFQFAKAYSEYLKVIMSHNQSLNFVGLEKTHHLLVRVRYVIVLAYGIDVGLD